MNKGKVNLFIYGSLRDSKIFHSVSGRSFSRKTARADSDILFAEPALLPGHRRVSPDNVYFYAVSDDSSKIEGLVVHNVPASALAEIDRYEGRRYKRETVRVNTAGGFVEAQAYLASRELMTEHFGDRFHVNLIHELWLRKRIEKFIKKHTRPGDQTTDAVLERQAHRELLATTERDLVISHYRSDAVSDYYLEHELDRPRPSIKHLYNDPGAKPFIKKYLALVIKQVLLNQLDEKIQSRYRFELEHLRISDRYFKRSISLLVALQTINANSQAVDLIVQQCLETMPYEKYDLIDYIKYAVGAARSLFDARVVRAQLDRIRSDFQPGLVPLGAEIELSNLGYAAVEPQRTVKRAYDPVYDGFRYFYDFSMDVLFWKLGGYIDDHTGSTDQARRVGFLELAPGRLNIAGELSRPATADPGFLISSYTRLAPFTLSGHTVCICLFSFAKIKSAGRKSCLWVLSSVCLSSAAAPNADARASSGSREWATMRLCSAGMVKSLFLPEPANADGISATPTSRINLPFRRLLTFSSINLFVLTQGPIMSR